MPQKMVRTDSRAGSLDAFFRPSQPLISPGKASFGGDFSAEGRGDRKSHSASEDKGARAGNDVCPTVGGGKGKGSRDTVRGGLPGETTLEEDDDEGSNQEDGDVENLEKGVRRDSHGEDGDKKEEEEEGVDLGLSGMGMEDAETSISASLDESEKKRKKRAVKGGKPISKPFSGVGHPSNCDCCGGKRPMGNGGKSLVMVDMPGPAANQQQQYKRPATFVDTDCRYQSVRSLIEDFKAQVRDYGHASGQVRERKHMVIPYGSFCLSVFKSTNSCVGHCFHLVCLQFSSREGGNRSVFFHETFSPLVLVLRAGQ